MAPEQWVTVAGRRLKVTNLDKVMYPATGTTKADVFAYYRAIAPVLIPQAAWRPVTRKRWVDGVGTAEAPGEVFFRKDLEDSAPEWVPRASIEHSSRTNVYPLANDEGVLAWFAQVAALELHVPQWRFDRAGVPQNPDRMVIDLDPGEGVTLADCARVARLCREVLVEMGMDAVPVTSGSKGIHLYAPLDGTHASAEVSEVARELARAMEADHPDLVVSLQRKVLREGKVLIDWSQNSAAKTTVCPYSLRGRLRPTVAAPRTWDELADPALRQLGHEEVLERVAGGLDPIAAQGWRESDGEEDDDVVPDSRTDPPDRLATYRSMRDAARTPEPVPDGSPAPSTGSTFVIQEHHARRLHWDLRLERDGVLVSWAVPKGPPLSSGTNRLAVRTED
ncbi:MAG: non-homologous end-joining DNA ligase, partial [Actinomycetota bacterium]